MACIICGKSNDTGNSKKLEKGDNLSSFERDIFSSWKQECVAATCQVLFDSKSEHFVDYFQNAEYCSCCEQVVRDLGFTCKQIQSFQNQIFQLSRKIYKNLDENYHKIKDKSAADVVTSRISSQLFVHNESVDFSNYSFEEMIEIIYAVISSPESPGSKIHSFGSHSFISSNCAQQAETEFTTMTETNDKIRVEPLQNNNLILKMEGEIDNVNGLQVSHPEEEFFATPKYENIVIDYPDYSVIASSEFEDNTTENSYFNTELTTNNETKTDGSIENCGEKTILAKNTSDLTHQLKCPYANCKLRFDTEQKMQTHFYSAHDFDKDKPYSCPACPMKFNGGHTLRTHMKIVHDKSLLCNRCCYCGKLFEKISDLTLHYEESHQIKGPYKCALCSAYFKTLEHLNNHIDQSHSFDNVDEIQLMLDVPPSDQELPPTSFKEINSINNDHDIETLSYNSSIVIPKTATERFTENSIKKISAPNASNSESKLVKCAFGNCPLSFDTERQMQKHFYTIHGFDKPYSCPGCPLRFIDEFTVRSHMSKEHDKSLAYNRCSFCGKLFKNKNQLTLHYSNSHKQPTPFKCGFCRGFFKNREYLINHTNKSHPNSYKKKKERDLTSPESDGSTSPESDGSTSTESEGSTSTESDGSNSIESDDSTSPEINKSVKRPKKVNNKKIKKIQCKICSNIFKDHLSLQEHTKANHSTRYVCGICGKSYNSRKLMNSHEKTHAVITARNKQCKFCDKRFLTSLGLEQHEKTHSKSSEAILPD